MRGPERRLRALQAPAPTACLLSTAVGPVQTSPLLDLQSLHILSCSPHGREPGLPAEPASHCLGGLKSETPCQSVFGCDLGQQVTCFIPLSLSFFICNMGVINKPHHQQGYCEA